MPKGIAAALVIGGLASAPAQAEVTIGSPLTDPTSGEIQIAFPRVYVQTALPVAGYRMSSPVNGTVVSWSVRGTRMSGGPQNDVKLRILQPSGGTFVASGSSTTESLPKTINDDVLRSFSTSLPIRIGDQIGVAATTNTAFPTATNLAASFEAFNSFLDGHNSGAPTDPSLIGELQFNALVTPINTFSLSPVQVFRKTGTAALTATLSNPGTLTAQGSIVRPQTVTVSAEGPTALTLTPTKRTHKRLKKKGKASGQVEFTFTPSFGSPTTQTALVALKLKRRHP